MAIYIYIDTHTTMKSRNHTLLDFSEYYPISFVIDQHENINMKKKDTKKRKNNR